MATITLVSTRQVKSKALSLTRIPGNSGEIVSGTISNSYEEGDDNSGKLPRVR